MHPSNSMIEYCCTRFWPERFEVAGSMLFNKCLVLLVFFLLCFRKHQSFSNLRISVLWWSSAPLIDTRIFPRLHFRLSLQFPVNIISSTLFVWTGIPIIYHTCLQEKDGRSEAGKHDRKLGPNCLSFSPPQSRTAGLDHQAIETRVRCEG